MIDREEILTEAQQEEYCNTTAEELTKYLNTLNILENGMNK